MLRNYLVIALRNLARDKFFSLINIAGLSIGLACVVMIVAYVREELSYDRFHRKHERIYRITTEWYNDGVLERTAQNHSPLAPLLTGNLTHLEKSVRIFPHSGLVSIDGQDKVRENRFCFADSAFFEVFDFTAIHGSLSEALYHPMSVVLTRSAATRYFGVGDAVGRELIFEDSYMAHRFNVAAVIDDMPENSHFHFDFIASFVSLKTLWPSVYHAWHHPPIYLYALMSQAQEVAVIDAQLAKVAESRLPDYVRAEKRAFFSQPIASIRLESNLQNEWEANSSYSYIRIFSTIAVFLLALACINYMNLATAKSARRAGEVGIRKAMGSARGQLMRMFLGESLATTFLSMIIGLLLSQFAMTFVFGQLFGKGMSVAFLFRWPYLPLLAAGWLMVSLLAGLYPAFYISSFRPVNALKGKAEGVGSALGLRKFLVVLQFFISVVLLVGSFVVIRQTDFMREKALGFESDHVVTISLNDRHSQVNYSTLKARLTQESFVENVTVSAGLPGGEGFYGWEVVPEGFEDRVMEIKSVNTDEDFIKTYGVTLLAGRDFSKDTPTDREEAFIINEALAAKLDWDDPVGKEVQLTFYTNNAVVRKGKVIGVVKDFHFQSLYTRIEPLIIFINTHSYYADFLSVRLSAGNLESQINVLRSAWEEFSPDKPFEFAFLNDNLNALYANEQKTGQLLSIFTGLSVAISCLGLFGLASFSVQQRTKEIGIRKVLGASALGILKLLTREFVLLVVIASVLAIPAAWYGTDQWLSRFAYKVDVGWTVLVASVLIILVVTLLTVGWHSLRAAIANPVRALRYE